MENILLEKWNSEVVLGLKKPERPPLIPFINCDLALKLLDKHIRQKSVSLVHCDVDGDGIGSGKILIKTLGYLGYGPRYCKAAINHERVHGVTPKIVDVVKNNGIDFLIILDSSTNSLDIIKQIPCDVLVIDHHEVSHNELIGNTTGGIYCIVNNTVSNSEYDRNRLGELGEYIADDRMSCGLVVFEFLRLYFKWLNQSEDILIYNNLHQWAAVTLLTDAVLLLSDRNQWYMENTFYTDEIETTLSDLLHRLNKYKSCLSKSFVSFSLAPILNKAIRAGQSSQALDAVLYHPSIVEGLNKYSEIQAKMIQTGEKLAKHTDSYIDVNTTDSGISEWYFGVIASRLSGDFGTNCICYHIVDGVACGSFRGKHEGIDYREFFDKFSYEIFAQGHKTAFGFKAPIVYLDKIMDTLYTIEPNSLGKPYLTVGVMPIELQGKYHLEELAEFKKSGLLIQLAIANSKLSSSEVLPIITTSNNIKEIRRRGKLIEYDACGISCKAFEEINSPLVSIYLEYSQEVEAYIRNYKITFREARK